MAVIKNKKTSTGTAKNQIPRAKRKEQIKHGKIMKFVKERMHPNAGNGGKLAQDNDIDAELNELREKEDMDDVVFSDTEQSITEPKQFEADDEVFVFNDLPSDLSGKNGISKAERRRQYVMPTPVTRGVVYLGRIPHGFYENEMRNYFAQFGEVTRIRLSRNKKTGKSKHYAFIEYSDPNVADIVASTMNGYIMFGQVLICKRIAHDQVHPELFKGANRTFRVVNLAAKEMTIVNRLKSRETVIKHVKQLISAERLRASKLKELGIDYDWSDVSFETLAKHADLVPNKNKQSDSEIVLDSSTIDAETTTVSELCMANAEFDASSCEIEKGLALDATMAVIVSDNADTTAEESVTSASKTEANKPKPKNKRPSAVLGSSSATKSKKKPRNGKKSAN